MSGFKTRPDAGLYSTYLNETSCADYQSNRLIITTNVIFTLTEQFFISLDPDVLLPIASYLRDSMGITDASFLLFEIASEPSRTSQSSTTTMLNRTVTN
jgi:hypothetical protein